MTFVANARSLKKTLGNFYKSSIEMNVPFSETNKHSITKPIFYHYTWRFEGVFYLICRSNYWFPLLFDIWDKNDVIQEVFDMTSDEKIHGGHSRNRFFSANVPSRKVFVSRSLISVVWKIFHTVIQLNNVAEKMRLSDYQ